jgi:hypothetical protein
VLGGPLGDGRDTLLIIDADSEEPSTHGSRPIRGRRWTCFGSRRSSAGTSYSETSPHEGRVLGAPGGLLHRDDGLWRDSSLTDPRSGRFDHERRAALSARREGPEVWRHLLRPNVVIGTASVAPAYCLAATLGFIVAVQGVGLSAPAVLLVSFLPMLCIAT